MHPDYNIDQHQVQLLEKRLVSDLTNM